MGFRGGIAKAFVIDIKNVVRVGFYPKSPSKYNGGNQSTRVFARVENNTSCET
jgi:hypothetical protein